MKMNTKEILDLLAKGLSALPTLIEGGTNVIDRISQMKKLAEDAKAGKVTKAQIDAIRAQTDRDLDEFNSPLPPERG
jgi:hypothetical protein